MLVIERIAIANEEIQLNKFYKRNLFIITLIIISSNILSIKIVILIFSVMINFIETFAVNEFHSFLFINDS